jgi:hypothetical protein
VGRSAYKIFAGNLKERDHSEDLGVNKGKDKFVSVFFK